jgi:putative transposase
MAGELKLPAADRVVLERVARSSVEPHRRVVQARVLLALAGGTPVETTAADLGTWPKTVRRWRAKYLAGGVAAVGTIAPGRAASGGSTPRWSRRSWPTR